MSRTPLEKTKLHPVDKKDPGVKQFIDHVKGTLYIPKRTREVGAFKLRKMAEELQGNYSPYDLTPTEKAKVQLKEPYDSWFGQIGDHVEIEERIGARLTGDQAFDKEQHKLRQDVKEVTGEDVADWKRAPSALRRLANLLQKD